MSTPSTLRPKEEVIEEFGVSIKYTLLLVGIGVIVIGIVLFARFANAVAFASAADALGLLGPLILDAATVLVALMGVYLIGLGLFLRISYHYYLTTQRVISSIGFFSQRIVSAEYKTVSDLIVRQDAISHLLLGTGSLGVNTFGGQPEEVELANIDNPTGRREQLRGLAETVQGGRQVTANLLQELKQEKGMLASNEPDANDVMSPSVDTKRTSVKLPDVLDPELTTTPPVVPSSTDTEIVDLNGDGIDESDKLRAAQKKMRT